MKSSSDDERIVRIGTRASKLAMVQTQMVYDYIVGHCPGIKPEIVSMTTTGDRILDKRLDSIGGKGLFVKELDLALREDRSDLSVHSLKDMPMEVPEDLPIIGFSKREDPRDVLVLPEGAQPGDALDMSKPLGCSSLRRTIQLAKLYPGWRVESIRGNVQTRLSKLDSGEYGALVLAAAGLKRLGLEHRIHRFFEPEELLPAAGQGIIALQGRADLEYTFLNGFLDGDSFCAATAERAFVSELDGGCSSPIAAHAVVEHGTLKLTGLYYDEASDTCETGTVTGDTGDAEKMGRELARELKGRGEKK